MKNTKTIIAATLSFAFAMSASANLININTPSGYSSVTSSGDALFDSAGDWTFSLGSFGGGFEASFDNIDLWSANWTEAFSAGFIQAGPPSQVGRINSTQALEMESLVGTSAFIWGYNSLDVSPSSEWILVTNDSWTFPEIDPLATAPSETWSFAAPGTVAILGSVSETGMTTQAIPEPSTYALIFGLGILGFLGYRRTRK